VCIEYHKAACAACGFEYSSKYKELGTGYIEVHHLKPIADNGGEYELDPVADLRPVCANCHRMLHMKRPPLSIEELIQIIRRE
jgi:5-methylcytosine-specific restriction protein A